VSVTVFKNGLENNEVSWVGKFADNRSGGNSTYNKSATLPVTDTDERLKAGQALEPESEMQF
jgi:hypothetical protein